MLSFDALVLRKLGCIPERESIEMVDELTRGQVLVKIQLAGLCGKQVEEIEGFGGVDPYLPHLFGHEAYGEVLRIGPGVSRLAPGDKVIAHWRKTLGINSDPPRFKDSAGNTISAGWVTTFASHSICSENRLTKIADDLQTKLPENLLPLFGCAATTGMGIATYEVPEINTAQRILLVGLGGIGRFVLLGLLARSIASRQITVLDKNQTALNLALKNDKDLITATPDNIDVDIAYDFIIICSGDRTAIEVGLKCMGTTSTVIQAGVPHNDPAALVDMWKIMHGAQIRGSMGGDTKPERDIPKFIRLVHELSDQYGSLIAPKVWPVSDFRKAYELMKTSGGRHVFDMQAW